MRRGQQGFSLVELLVSMAVLSLLLTLMGRVMDGSTRAWKQGRNKVARFAEARQAFETIQHRLSQATLATTWTYRQDPSAPTIPLEFVPSSNLFFRSGQAADLFAGGPSGTMHGHGVLFAAPIGWDVTPGRERFRGLLNLCGFFVSHGPDDDIPNAAQNAGVTSRQRFRLFEMCQPASELTFADTSAESVSSPAPVSAARAKPLAGNIILLVISPMGTERPDAQTNAPFLSPDYRYDSAANNHELPASVRVVLVAIDEESAERVRSAGRESGLLPQKLFTHAAGSADLDRDLEDLRQHLDHGVGVRVAYQIFDATIALPASRWNA